MVLSDTSSQTWIDFLSTCRIAQVRSWCINQSRATSASHRDVCATQRLNIGSYPGTPIR